MSLNNLIETVFKGCDLKIFKSKLIKYWLDNDNRNNNDESYIIGIKNNIVKTKSINTIENRITLSSNGYDVFTVSSADAKRLWKKPVFIILEEINPVELTAEINQVSKEEK